VWSWPTRGVAKAPSDELVLFRLRSTQNMEIGESGRYGVDSIVNRVRRLIP
jgi:hypothetical protein